MIDLKRTFYLVAIPTSLVIMALLFASQLEPVSETLTTQLPFIPYTVFMIGLVLTWVFSSNKEWILLAIITLSYWLLTSLIHTSALPNMQAHKDLSYALTSIFVPINFLIFNHIKERGLLNRYGLRRILFIVIQAVLIYVILFHGNKAFTSLLFIKPLVLPYFTPLPQLSLFLFGIAVIGIVFHMILQPTVLQSGQLAALLFFYLALHNVNNPSLMQLNFTVSGFVLVFAVLLHSYNLAYSDELTGLPARRALKQYLLGLGQRYTLAMVDVDNFKKLNDTYGHDVGDQVLRKLAKALRNAPGNAKAFRYGGEEFTIVYANKDIENAADYAEELRKIVADDPFVLRHASRPRTLKNHANSPTGKIKTSATRNENSGNINFSISIGLAEFSERHKSAFDTLKQADKALYAAKRKGRNCVVKAKRR